MAAEKQKVGDAVLHRGRQFTIIGLPDRAVKKDGTAVLVDMIVFSNDTGGSEGLGSRVIGEAADFVWSEEDKAWYGLGALLAQDECIVYEALLGVRPPPETHLTARKVLDMTDYADVPRERLITVVEKRQGLEGAEAEEYADACMVRCAEMREARHG